VRICTWNILLGLRLGAVLDALRSLPDFSGLDLLALQEASVHDGTPDAQTIAEAMGDEYVWFQANAQKFRDREQGNALIWRKELFGAETRDTVSLSDIPPEKYGPAERALLRVIPPQRRIAVRAESPDLRVYVMHLDVVGFTHKLEQFRAILTDMAARPAVSQTIVAGDLNTFGPPRLQPWRRLRVEAQEAGLVELTKDLTRTHWTRQKLDAVYLRAQQIPPHRAWTANVRASDHLPVFVEY
jgi:endonuclease/exonuclease/phosphatase family metal-dependent hydrolase